MASTIVAVFTAASTKKRKLKKFPSHFSPYVLKLEQGSGFHDPIKKLKFENFSSLRKRHSGQGNQQTKIVLKADNRVFGQMLLISQNRKLIDMEVAQNCGH